MPTSSEAGLDVEGEGEISLLKAEPGKTYVVKSINTGDQEMNAFLFRLGCYEGEPITLVSKKRSGCVVVIKDGRYNFDSLLSEAVLV
ncbi:MAG: ferrous iron transport protein A [Eggerthellaceae bacterium]|nr:ferrous iron transport protein A [Eggerthellaceae bacterium]